MFNNLKLGLRLTLSFGLVLCFSVGLALTGIGMLSTVMGGFRAVSNDLLPKINIANQNIQAAYDYARAFAYIVTSSERPGVDLAAIQRAEVILADTVKRVNDNTVILEKTLVSNEEKALLAQVIEQRKAYGSSRNRVLELRKSGQHDQAVDLMFSETNRLQTVYIDAIKSLISHEHGLLQQSVIDAERTYGAARTILLAILGAVLVVGLWIAAMITRGIVKSLGGEPDYAVAVAGRIAAGDLNTPVELKPNDQGSLLFAMRQMRDNLAGIVGQLRTGTETIASASSQIAAGNLDLSARTEQQAGALEETAASMEELTSTVRQNADNARQANSLANTASEVARKGGTMVTQVVETMGSINQSSRKIVDIIAVIDGIAFQTNILALNAAVEAARAGEQGRGFAVVASEVRTLAQRSAAAAKEIKTLIGDSVQKVDLGARLVDEAGANMSEIVESVRRVSDVIGEIATASQEQSTGIDQINQAITQMDQVTQQNAALVEQAAAAADSLQLQAANLAQIVSIFKLGNEAPGHVARPAKPVRAGQRSAITPVRKQVLSRRTASASRVLAAPGSARPAATGASATAGPDWEEF